jgi:hypothetical protein
MIDWSHSVWVLLHALALSCKKDNYDEWLKIMKEMELVIICGMCRYHYIEFTKKYEETNPDYLKDYISAFKFTVDVHNSVNEKLEKPIVTSCNDALDLMKKFVANKPISEWRTDLYTRLVIKLFPCFVKDDSHELIKQRILKVFDFLEHNIEDNVFELIKLFPEGI